ncbi:MAG TPA: phage tail protein [Candidatus Thermoplasmatota archaeon]|nr:phage tail protein [Candidatus Thermoplasmatota archaeon]
MTPNTKSIAAMLGCVLLATVALSSLSMSAPGDAARPHTPTQRVQVHIEGLPATTFLAVNGLEAETEVIQYVDGADGTVRMLPGKTSYAPITLSRPFTGNTDLWNWFASAAEGQVERRDVAIVIVDGQGQPLGSYRLENAWPVKYSNPHLKASGNEVAVETVELVYEDLTLSSGDEDDN